MQKSEAKPVESTLVNKVDLQFTTNENDFALFLVVDLYNFFTKSLEQMQMAQALTLEFHTGIIFVMIT